MIKFDNIQIKYGDFIAIDNLNLDIHEGEFFTFLTFRMVNQLL